MRKHNVVSLEGPTARADLDIKIDVWQRVLSFLIRHFSNYYTLHRSDLAARAAPLDPRLHRLGQTEKCFNLGVLDWLKHTPFKRKKEINKRTPFFEKKLRETCA